MLHFVLRKTSFIYWTKNSRCPTRKPKGLVTVQVGLELFKLDKHSCNTQEHFIPQQISIVIKITWAHRSVIYVMFKLQYKIIKNVTQFHFIGVSISNCVLNTRSKGPEMVHFITANSLFLSHFL